jgi:threonine synthase
MRNVQAAVCIQCGAEHAASRQRGGEIYTCEQCGGVLEIVYDYGYIKPRLTRKTLAARTDWSMWRYRELLPVEEDSRLCPLRAGWSPLYRADALGGIIGLHNLYIKDDGLNPTSSLKDRASAIAVTRAVYTGKDTIACSSTGNAASSLAGASAAMGLASVIFVPERAPQGKVTQLLIFGATVVSVRGNYEETFRFSAQAIEQYGWYNRNAAINPFLSEGKKTVSLEIAEQLGFTAPDFVAVSVGDGCTIAGVWKGFKDLYALDLIDRLPRLVSVQAAGCCPVNRAIEQNAPIEWMDENTLADSIAVGSPRNGDKALAAIRESGGITVTVTDDEILAAMRLLGKSAGVFGEPAGVAGTAGLIQAAARKLIPADAVVVSVVTGNGLKDAASAQRASGGGAGASNLIRIEPDMALLTKEFAQRGMHGIGI